MTKNVALSENELNFGSKSELSFEKRKILNEQVDILFSELHIALVKKDTKQIKDIILNLEKCALKLKSQFLDDILFIVKHSLKSTEKQGENNDAKKE